MFIRSKIHLLIIGLSILSVFYSGCSVMNIPIYPEVIYNNRQPLISVTYEYGEIEVILPLSYDGDKPENISFKVYGHGDTLNPIISILQEASNQFRTYLPQGVLDINDENNLIKIIPENSDFHPVNVKFKGIRFGKLELSERTIYSKPLIVRGRIFLNSDFTKSLADVNISIMSFDQILQTTKTDNAGLYKIAIPGENKDLESLRLVIGENLIFKPYRKNLDFSETFKIKFDAGVGPSLRMKEPLYMINKNNAHFREGPDIGSKTLFLLEKGEVVSVQRITPSEFKVSIEVKLESSNKVVIMEGWVLRSDLVLLNTKEIFKREI